jgi:hypothetical protein
MANGRAREPVKPWPHPFVLELDLGTSDRAPVLGSEVLYDRNPYKKQHGQSPGVPEFRCRARRLHGRGSYRTMGCPMEKDYLIPKRASVSRPSGEWSDDDFDVLANGEVVGRIFKANAAPVGSPWMWGLHLPAPRTPHANPRLRCDARGRHGCIRQELAAEVMK